MLLPAILLLAGMPVAAQKAHYLGQQIVVDDHVTYPQGVAVDAFENVYVPDSANNRVYFETPSLTGTQSYTRTPANGIATTNGGVVRPGSLAVDGHFNVYVISGNPASLLELSPQPNGIYNAHTLGSGDYAGVAVDAYGTVLVSNQGGGNSSLLRFKPAGSGFTQTPVGPGWNQPQGVAVDRSDNVYVAATGTAGSHGNVYQVRAACNGQNCPEFQVGGNFGAPFGVAVDLYGAVYIADLTQSSIWKVPALKDGVNQGSSSLVGYGFKNPSGVAVDLAGAVYVADSGNNRVVKIQTGPVYFGSWEVGTTSAPPQTIRFMFDQAGTLGGVFVNTTGSTFPGATPGKDFNDTGTGTCKAHRQYNPGDICTLVATCSPQKSAVMDSPMGTVDFGGSAGLIDSAKNVIAFATLECTGTMPAAASGPGGHTRLVCTTYDACGDVVSYSPQTIGLYNQPAGVVTSPGNPGSGCLVGTAHPPVQTICTPESVVLAGAGGVTGSGRYLDREVKKSASGTPSEKALSQSIESAQVSEVTATSATVSWKTSVPAQSGVMYAAEGGSAQMTPNLAAASTEPSFKLANLKPGTRYHLTAWSYAGADEASIGLSFTTGK